MAGPLWVRWLLALAYLGLAAYCLARLLPRGTHRDAAAHRACVGGSHGLMAGGMAAMFAPVVTPVPAVWWAVVFAAHTGWLAVRLARTAVVTTGDSGGWRDGRAHLVPHLLGGGVMAVAFAAMPSGSPAAASHLGHLGHLGAADPLFALAVWAAAGGFLAQAVRCGVRMALIGDQVPEPQPAGPTAHLARRGAETELPLRLAMGLGMSFMLITMF